MSYSVTQRQREIGIRLALGAQRKRIVRQVLGEGLVLAGLGSALGLATAVVAGRLVRGLLYGVGALDPVAFGVVPLLLVGVAGAAAYLPARRAAAVDPMRTLRAE
jgi:ABC-type antimicrobial peptide transport system permease subunit